MCAIACMTAYLNAIHNSAYIQAIELQHRYCCARCYALQSMTVLQAHELVVYANQKQRMQQQSSCSRAKLNMFGNVVCILSVHVMYSARD